MTPIIHVLANGPTYDAFGVSIASKNLIVISNTFIGNPAITHTVISPGVDAVDGLVWFAGGGNNFVARNLITNYNFEAIALNGGPSAVVQNTFKTFLHNYSTCALYNSSGPPPLNLPTNGEVRDHSVSFVGNSVDGGRWVAKAVDSTRHNVSTLSGNTASLNLPFDVGGDPFGGFAILRFSASLNLSGNTLSSGYIAAQIWNQSTNLLILKNDFSGATHGGIFFDGDSNANVFGSRGQATLAKNLLSKGSTFHARAQKVADGTRVFLYGNSFRSPISTNVPTLFDPISLSVHIGN